MAVLEVAVVPRASAHRVGPYENGVLRVRVVRPPADGEANRAVIRLVADALGLAPSRLELIAGRTARRKRLRVDGIDPDELDRRLRALPAD
jgi:uncharacterized protein YggU (UPF0235/DUF167 family)